MNKSRSSQKRVMSASLHSQKRQVSFNSKLQQKRFGRTFTQSYDGDNIVKGNRSKLYTSTGDHMNKTIGKVGKGPEQLIEQNFHLKNELSDMNNKLYLTRSKIESQKKKHLIYAKKLNRQFEKQLYWQNDKQNEYLITGIKSQYEKLKQSLQQKCEELEMIKKSISATQIDELTLYCEALETQNKALLQNISFLKKSKKRSNSNFQDYSSTTSKFNYQNLQSLLSQHRQKQEKYKSKIKLLEQQLAGKSDNEMQLQKKVKFLQKLMIEKQNDSYHCQKRVKAVEKEKQKLSNKLKIIESKISKKEKDNQAILEQLQAKYQRQAQMQKSMFEKLIRQKNIMIDKLQKEIGYLSTLLSYWKPLDELDKIDQLDSSLRDKTLTVQNQSMSLHVGPSRQFLNRPKTPVSSMFVEENNNQERFLLKSIHNQEFLNKDLSFVTINKEEENQVQNDGNRQPRKSNKKWAQDAKKCRKVQLSEVQQLGELIKYKMIAHKISPNVMKEYFSHKLQRSNSSKMDEELICMKELKQILISQPFDLLEQDAFLLSRYVIEDEGVEHVYCHEGNQLQRSIVKSILKALVGDYSLPDRQKSQAKWKQIKRIYSHNLQLVLKSICPKGVITKDKFLEMFKSLGIEIEDQTKSYLVGKLIEQQKSLKSLKYDILFTSEQRIE